MDVQIYQQNDCLLFTNDQFTLAIVDGLDENGQPLNVRPTSAADLRALIGADGLETLKREVLFKVEEEKVDEALALGDQPAVEDEPSPAVMASGDEASAMQAAANYHLAKYFSEG